MFILHFDVTNSLLESFPLCLKNIFSIFWAGYMSAKSLFSFFIYCWRILLLGIEFWADNSFLSALYKHYFTSFWSPPFLMWTLKSLKSLLPYHYAVVFFNCIQDLSLPFVFSCLIMIYMGTDLFVFLLLRCTKIHESIAGLSFSSFFLYLCLF